MRDDCIKNMRKGDVRLHKHDKASEKGGDEEEEEHLVDLLDTGAVCIRPSTSASKEHSTTREPTGAPPISGIPPRAPPCS